MGVTTATKLCETSTVKANTGTDEIVSKSVLFLERYCQTRMVAKNLQVDRSYHVAARAISPIAIEGTDRPVDKCVGFWQAEALSYFRKSAWEDVVYHCMKVLSIPAQSEINYDVQFQIGYASMRLGDYSSAAKYFLRAYQIDSRHVALRLAMLDLRTTITTRPYQKRTREEPSDERRRVATKTSFCLQAL